MKRQISIAKSKYYEIPIQLDDAFRMEMGKGWSFSNIYNLRLLKDIYLIIAKKPKLPEKQLKDIIAIDVIFDKDNSGNTWDDKGRKALEYINALKNFELIDNSNSIIKERFINSEVNESLSDSDIEDLKTIFFSYIRFREFSLCFLQKNKRESKLTPDLISESVLKSFSSPVFAFSLKSRFTDSLIYEFVDNPGIYSINEKMSHAMRFWDVFTTWGEILGLIEKINIFQLGYEIEGLNRAVNITYFINNMPANWDLLLYLNQCYKSKYIDLVGLIMNMISEFRCTVENAKKVIIEQSLKYKEYVSLQKTSSGFIKNKTEQSFLPLYNGSYVSHILLR
jgi:hypothetical protein